MYLKKVALFRGQVIQRDVGGVRVLADQHGVSVAEGATPHVLAAETYVESLIEQAADSHSLTRCPVNVRPRFNPTKTITNQALLETIVEQLHSGTH